MISLDRKVKHVTNELGKSCARLERRQFQGKCQWYGVLIDDTNEKNMAQWNPKGYAVGSNLIQTDREEGCQIEVLRSSVKMRDDSVSLSLGKH